MEQKYNNNRLDLQVLLEFCEREGEEISYRKGDQLEREGDPARWFAFVTEGCFKYVKYGMSDDKAHITWFSFEGEFVCDYPTFLYDRPSQATIEAMVPSRVLRVTGQQLEQFFNQNMETMKLRAMIGEHILSQFRYKNFKTTFLNELLQHANIESLKSSFAFMHELLQGFSPFLIFVPSPEPTKVSINVKLNKEMVDPIWTDPMEMSVVKSISFDGHNLLATDDDSNVFPFTKEQDIREEALESMLCEGYGIPSTYLNLIYNEEPVKKIMWLDRKFKRNFRNDTETAELAMVESAAE